MKPRFSNQAWYRSTAAACAGLGLLLGPANLPASARALVVTTGDAAGASESASDAVNAAMRQAELAISRAADVGKSVALRLTSGGMPRALVVPGADMAAEEADRIAEDLGVMSRILEKAAGQNTDRGDRIWLNGMLGGAFGRGPDAFYLDGYGVLFLLRVEFALVGPKAVRTEDKAEVTDRTWEETRRELRGGASGENRIWEMMTGAPNAAPRGEYDADRVQELRVALVQALKHASNLNQLKPEETVAVIVSGPVAGDPDRPAKSAGRRGDATPASGVEEAAPSGSLLTLRARKADVDAFARGQLTVEDFGKKVRETLR